MYQLTQDERFFFDRRLTSLPLYEAFADQLFACFPDTATKVQKSQITFSNRHVYACVSFLRVKKKAELPDPWLVITLGLSYPLASNRVEAKTEPYPGRWTTHFVISSPDEIDGEFLSWIRQAYEYAASK